MIDIFGWKIMSEKEWDDWNRYCDERYSTMAELYVDAEKRLKVARRAVEYYKKKARDLGNELKLFREGKAYNGFTEIEHDELKKVTGNEVYKGAFYVLTKKGDYPVHMSLRDYFQVTDYMRELAKAIGITDEKTNLGKFIKALHYVQENLTYMHDEEQWGHIEQFTPPWITLATDKDDCESLALATIGLYLAGGGNPNCIFLGLGTVEIGKKKFGHGFVVFKQPKNETAKTHFKTKWWIGEATYFRPFGPVGWDKVKNYKAVWGLANPFGQYLFREDAKYPFKNWPKRKGQPDLKNNRW